MTCPGDRNLSIVMIVIVRKKAQALPFVSSGVGSSREWATFQFIMKDVVYQIWIPFQGEKAICNG